MFLRGVALCSRVTSMRGMLAPTRYAANAAAEPTTSSPPIPPPAPEGEDKPVSPKIAKLVDEIASLNLFEVADLNSILKKKLDLPDTPVMSPGMFGAMPAGRGATDDAEAGGTTGVESAQISFTVKLTKFDETKKIALIKEIKNVVPGLNLVQAKKFVEGLPQTVRADIGKDEAEKLKEALNAVGGTANVE